MAKRLDPKGTIKRDGYEYYNYRGTDILIRQKETPSGAVRYQCDYGKNPRTGKWERKSFELLTEARADVKRHVDQIIPSGTEGRTSLTTKQRGDAERAVDLLAGFSTTLEAAAAFYVRHHEAVALNRSVAGVVDAFIATKREQFEDNELRQVSLSAAIARTNVFKRAFGTKTHLANVTHEQITEVLRSTTGLHRENVRRAINSVYIYAIAEGICTENPIKKVRIQKLPKRKVGIYRPAEVRKLLVACDTESPELKPFLLFSLFAGIRSGEIIRKLRWEHVDFANGTIELPAEITKKLEERHIRMQPNLIDLLLPYAGSKGLVCDIPPASVHRHRAAVHKEAGVELVRNGGRHSFASYHLSKHNDLLWLTDDLGHDGIKMLKKHYRARVPDGSGAEYFEIGLNGSKVVDFPQAVSA